MNARLIFRGLLSSLLIATTILPARAQEPDFARLRERLKSGRLRWGGDAEGGAPYVVRDPNDLRQVIGCEVELADALAEVLGKKLGISLKAEFVQYEWVTLPAGLTSGKDFDLIIAGKEITKDEEEKLLYSRPYYIFRQQLVVRREDNRIESLEDCRDKAVGTLSGTAAEEILKEKSVGEIRAFDGQVEPYLDLEFGSLDAVLLDAPIALYYASTNPALKYAGTPFGEGAYGIGLRPDDGDLAAAVNDALGELMISGRLQHIYRKWHLWNLDQAELARGKRRAEELRGLGFTPAGEALEPNAPPPADAVDVNFIAAAAKQMTFDRYAPVLLEAAGMTVILSVLSMALAVALGLIVAVGRLYGPGPIRWLALGYVEFFRGIPLLLLIFFLYFGLRGYGVGLPAFWTGILAFGINYAAFEAEIYRTAILAVPTGQWEAARGLGMSDGLAFRRIIFPQALRIALPPMTNDFVALFKDTSLVSVIAVTELSKEYLILSRSSWKFVELGLLTAVLYLLMSVPLSYLSRYLEKKWGKGIA